MTNKKQLLDGTIVYECYLCHKYKPDRQMTSKGEYKYCNNCDEPIFPKEEPIEPAIIVIPKHYCRQSNLLMFLWTTFFFINQMSYLF